MSKLKFREMMKVSSVLTMKESSFFQNKLDVETQRRLYNLYLENEKDFKEEFNALCYKDNPEKLAKVQEKMGKQEDNIKSFFVTQGIYNPSEVTKRAFSNQSIMANFNKFYNAMGMITLNAEKQAMYNYYDIQQRQNFINVAQQDEIIKQNDKIVEQNETLIEQNEMMIELMKQMANK